MSKYIYSFHRFDDRDSFLQTCRDAGFQFYDDQPCPNEGDAIDDIGTLIDQENEGDAIDDIGTLIDQENEGGTPVILPGYHVNMAWKHEKHTAFEASEVTPQNPRRLWF